MKPIKRAQRPIEICMKCPGIRVFIFDNGCCIILVVKEWGHKKASHRYFSAYAIKSLAENKISIKKTGYGGGRSCEGDFRLFSYLPFGIFLVCLQSSYMGEYDGKIDWKSRYRTGRWPYRGH
jgi:hypothetical protein